MTKEKKFLPGMVSELRILGRTGKNGDDVVLFWTGSGFECNYEGTELWCEFESDYSVYEQWISVLVNGELMTRQMLNKGRERICLFRNMQTKKKNHIKVIKEVQAMPGDPEAYLAVCALYGDGVFYELPEPECRIEFIGDSITSGEGSYGATVEQDWIAMWFSATKAYPHLTAELLQAEYRIFSQSGYGVYCAYDNNLDHVMPKYYEQVCGVLEGDRNKAAGAWDAYDFSSWQPDYVLINLGTNDGGAFHNPEWVDEATGRRNKMYTDTDGHPAKECLAPVAQAVEAFLSLVRTHNPKAYIVWAYGVMGTVVEEAIRAGIHAFCQKTGDERVEYLPLAEMKPEQVGARSHPGIGAHRAVAEAVFARLREI